MKVFISWSGVRSKAVAQTLHTWLKDVIQAIDPWLSTEEIRKGRQWGAELTRELETTHIGVICLTPENLTAPWLLFEAGALSKLQREKNAHVCTYLIDMPYTAVTGPLESFQHTIATEEDTLRMAQSINAAIEDGRGRLTENQLKRAFERCWPELKQCLDTLPPPQEPIPPPRSPGDMLEEVLGIVRDLAKGMAEFAVRPEPSIFERMVARRAVDLAPGGIISRQDIVVAEEIHLRELRSELRDGGLPEHEAEDLIAKLRKF